MTVLTILIVTFCLFSVNGRLVDKNTEKNAETPPTEPTAPVRVSRQAFYEDIFGLSGEDHALIQDEFRPYIRRERYSLKSKSSDAKGTKDTKKATVTAVTKKVAQESEETQPPKMLIKKPIPKFNEMDYEDFQGKMNRSPVKYADSGEHEDEDFNLDDYEFDVNHDEFVGRGKPLEPRLKAKNSKGHSEKKTPRIRPTSRSPPEIKMQSKVVIPSSEPLVRTKHGISQKAAHKLKEDYYDDIVTTTKAPEVQVKRDSDEEFSDDTEESKESHGSKIPARIIRSPWFVEFLASRMGDKTAAVMSKVVESLPPIFPEKTSDKTQGVSSNANSPNVDPMTGNMFMF